MRNIPNSKKKKKTSLEFPKIDVNINWVDVAMVLSYDDISAQGQNDKNLIVILIFAPVLAQVVFQQDDTFFFF